MASFEPITREVQKGHFTIFPGLCKGCGLCLHKCPKRCLTWSKTLGLYGTPTVIPDNGACISCGICSQVCPDCAIVITKKPEEKKADA